MSTSSRVSPNFLRKRSVPAGLALVCALCLLSSPVLADVITLRDGRQQRGIIIRDHPDEPKITIRTTAGDVAIPRERIGQVQKETPAASHVTLGVQYLEQGDANRAAQEFRKALELDKDNAEAQARLKEAETALDAMRIEMRQVDEAKIDQSLAEVQRLVSARKFDDAAKLLRSLGMGYGTSKAPQVRKAYADTYVAWAIDRLDRQDPGSAAEKLQFALRLDPTHETARKLLIRAYEGDPTKLKEVAEFHKNSEAPADQLKRADALFRLRQFEEAIPIYLKYISDPQYATHIMGERLRLMFDLLHRQYADRGDYEGALRWYLAFLQFAPNESLLPAARYEYMIQRSKTDMNDPAARAALAEFAEVRGMPETARREYLNILSVAPEQPQALEGARRFATADLEDAKAFFAQGQYALAGAKAQIVASTYTMLPDVVREAEQLHTKASVEAGRQQQTRAQQAVALAERGDRYYEQGLSYMSALVSTNVDPNVRVFSPRLEAAKYFGWAIFSWQYALQIDPSLGDPASYDLHRKIADASAKYATMANRLPPPLPRRDLEASQIRVGPDVELR